MLKTIRSKIIVMIVVFLLALLGMVHYNLSNGFNNIAKSSSTNELHQLNAIHSGRILLDVPRNFTSGRGIRSG